MFTSIVKNTIVMLGYEYLIDTYISLFFATIVVRETFNLPISVYFCNINISKASIN